MLLNLSKQIYFLLFLEEPKWINSLSVPNITSVHYYFPKNNYLFKVINKNIKAYCKICPKLTIKASERRQWRRSGVFNDFVLVPLLLTLNIVHTMF